MPSQRRHAILAVLFAAYLLCYMSPLAVGYVLNVTHNDFNTALYAFVGFFIAAAIAALRIRS